MRADAGKRTAAFAAVLLLGLAYAGTQAGEEDPPPPRSEWELDVPAPVDDGQPTELDGWRDLACAECHVEIAREWASTRHALAWVDERYQKALKRTRRKKGCHGCHIPRPLHVEGLGGRPRAREESAPDPHHAGVTCRSCHLGPEGEILGPYGAETDAHPTRAHASFREEGMSQLCIDCHDTTIGPVVGIAKGFQESAVAAAGGSCVGCHMRPVERAVANGPDGEPDGPVRPGRSHRLQTPRDPSFLRRAFEVELVPDADGVTVRLANRTGHRVPGLVERELAFHAELLDADGEVVAEGGLTLDHRTYLPRAGHQEWRLEGDGTRVRLRADHSAPGLPRRGVRFLEEELPVPGR